MTVHSTGASVQHQIFPSCTTTRPVNHSAILAIIMISYMMIVLDTSLDPQQTRSSMR
jgi:hypothetical protein